MLTWLRHYRWQAVGSILLLALTVLASVGLMSTSGALISRAAITSDVLDLMVLITGVRFFGLTRGLYRYLERIVSHDLTFRLLGKVRVAFYRRLEPLAPSRLWDTRAGDLLARAVQDVDTLQFLYLRAFAPALAAIVVAAVSTTLLAVVAPAAALVAALGFLTVGLLLPWLANALTRGMGARQVALRADLNASLLDDSTGITDLLIFNAEGKRQERRVSLDAELGLLQASLAGRNALVSALAAAAASLTAMGVLMVGIPLVRSGDLPGFLLATLALGTLAAFEGFTPLPLAPHTVGAATAAAQRLREATSGEPPVQESRAPKPFPADLTLSFRDVSYRYGDEDALSGVSFDLPPGKRLAVVGASGAGKSTLLNLAARLLEPTSGEVALGGTNLRDLSLASLRARLAVVTQDAHAFDSTVRENLRLARPEADEAALWRALERARLAETVREMPDGLDTWVGESGGRLSGGEKQRLAIARAFLKDAPILLLDEATANLDTRTERDVLEAASNLMLGRTTLLVTHRITHALDCDEVIVLQDGRVIERGEPSRLAARGGTFAMLLARERTLLD
jgi:ATP-binding cassette subfamily C protein CydC